MIKNYFTKLFSWVYITKDNPCFKRCFIKTDLYQQRDHYY